MLIHLIKKSAELKILTILYCFVFLMPLHSLGNTKTAKQRTRDLSFATSLWQQAMNHAENDNEASLVKCCKEIVMLMEPSDSLYTMSRNVLAELAYEHEDMNEIYRHYAYFKYLNDRHDASGEYSELCNRLKIKYDSLLNEDRKRPITEGIYAAAMESGKYGTCLLIQICRVNGLWKGKILGGEARYEDKIVKGSKPELLGEILQSPDDNTGSAPEFSVMWNKFSRRDPNVSLSKSLVNASDNFGRNMAGELNSGRYGTSDVITGTLATGAVRGIMTGLAALSARGSSKYYNTELIWTPLNGGALDAKIIMSKVSQNTSQSDARKETADMPLKLIKIYPHTKAFFIDDKAKSIYFAEGITSQNLGKEQLLAWELCTHPLIFDSEAASLLGIDGKIDLKALKNNRHLNDIMFRLLVRNGVFQHFETDSIASSIGPLRDCNAHCSYNQVIYQRADKTGATAVYDRDGTEIYEFFADTDNAFDYVNAYDDNGYRFSSKALHNSFVWNAEIIYTDGFTYSGEVRYRNRDGRGILKSSDGKIWEGEFDSNDFKEGKFVVPTDSFTTTIYYTNYTPDSTATVLFQNGDVFAGPVDSEFRPHGKGVYTAKNKKPRETQWVAGQMIVQKQSTKRKKGKRASRYSKTRKK